MLESLSVKSSSCKQPKEDLTHSSLLQRQQRSRELWSVSGEACTGTSAVAWGKRWKRWRNCCQPSGLSGLGLALWHGESNGGGKGTAARQVVFQGRRNQWDVAFVGSLTPIWMSSGASWEVSVIKGKISPCSYVWSSWEFGFSLRFMYLLT